MRLLLALLLAGLSAYSAEVQIVVVGPITCTPFRVMVERELAPIAAAYPEVKVKALVPCTSPIAAAIAEWKRAVPAMTNVDVIEVTNALDLGPYWDLPTTPIYAGWVNYGSSCLMQWNHFAYRWQIEPCLEPYTRKLSICLSNGVPCATWRVGPGWDLEWGPMPGTVNGKIGRLRKR